MDGRGKPIDAGPTKGLEAGRQPETFGNAQARSCSELFRFLVGASPWRRERKPKAQCGLDKRSARDVVKTLSAFSFPWLQLGFRQLPHFFDAYCYYEKCFFLASLPSPSE